MFNIKYTYIVTFILSLLVLSSCASQGNRATADYSELSVDKANELFASGQLTSVELVNYYLNRIEKLNNKGIALNAVAQINPQALAIAKLRDTERQQGNIRGPLHGIPVLLKDNIDTADGMANTAGSYALKDHFPKNDAFLVSKLRQAGAIILGKANLSEWANFRSTKSSSGWSALWGQAKNPYDVTMSTCGSSAGSASAVAADLALLAIGTETDGSVTCPSSVNGIVGIKPSLGTVSRHGIIPISHSQDTAGPMAKSVSDAVYLLEAITAVDTNDSAALQADNNYTKHLKSTGLKGKRIGIASNLMSSNQEVNHLFEQAVAVLKENGAIIIENAEIPNIYNLGNDEFTVLLYDFKHDLNEYFNAAGLDLSLEKLIEFNEKHKDIEMPHFNQELFQMAQEKGPLTDKAYLDARKQIKLLAGEQGIDAVLKQHNLDLLIAPTSSPAWKIDWVNGDRGIDSASQGAAVSGYPHISVPMGYVKHLPIGLSFFGANLSEGTLIEAAFSYEQLTKHRVSPNL